MTPFDIANKAQRDAADPLASVFVTANAGSGKTKVLVDRIARLLLAGAQPSAFLCITYTKAAAAEMQRRLFERLGAWCVADDETLTKELAELGAPPAKPGDLGAARALFARALETPGGLRIQTIHAFCERLLARFPLEAGVPPGFDIADEVRANALLANARASCVRDADEYCAMAFTRFAARLHNEALEGLLDRLVLRRVDFKRYAHNHGGAPAAAAELRKRHGVTESAEQFIAAQLARAPWAALKRAAGVLGESTANDRKLADRILEALKRCDAGAQREALMCVAAVALTEKGAPRAPTKKLTDREPWLAPLFEQLASTALEALTGLNAIDRADDAQAALTLALKLDETYAASKTRAGALDFEDLITHAHALLSRSEAAPWVLYKLDGGIDHILIDEGQDTSPAQWDLIAPLQQEFFAGSGVRDVVRTVFAVGDPKQSIYGFQGADPDRFLREAHTLDAHARSANRKFVAPTLETSFRTVPEVLRAVDAVFKDRDLAPGAPEQFNEVRHLASRENEHGLVEVWPLAMRPQAPHGEPWSAPLDVETGASVHAQLARKIAADVKAWIDRGEGVWEKGVLRPMRAGDIMALVRTRGALFRELIKAFKRAGLPVAGADRMTLKDELAVEDCLALIRVALDPADDLALACVLKGPWCDLDDDDAHIFPLAHSREKGETLYARLMANTDVKYDNARAFIAAIVARGGEDAFAFLSWTLETPGADGRTGWQRMLMRLGAESRDPLEELLSRALRPSPYAAASLQRFLYEVETDNCQVKRELEGAGGSVRVMTVHGAKGLEAPVVILPDATASVSERPEDGLIFTHDGPFLSPNKKADDAAMAAARTEFEADALGEHLRLLYVAMTRARDRLIVCGAQFGTSNAGEAKESWRLAVEEALTQCGASVCETPFGDGLRLGAPLMAEKQDAAGAADAATLPAFARTPVKSAPRRDATAPSRLKRADPAVFSPRGDGLLRFRRGRLIHGLLQRLPDVAPKDRKAAALRWLTRQGADADEAAKLAAEALAVVETESFAAVFSQTSRAEVPVIGEVAGRAVRGVVDRLAVEKDGVLVLDFKTDRPAPTEVADVPEAYVLQMACYRAVMQKIFPEKPVRCALLWTEAPHLMELKESSMDAALDGYSRS